MKLTNLKNFLLFSGSSITLIVGLLAAFIPGLAYVTVHSYFVYVPVHPYGLPYVYYPSLDFSTHIYTTRLFISALGGLIGLLAMFGKSKQPLIGAFSIAVASLGLMLPATGDMRLTFPEMRLFDVPWIGSFLVVVGVSLMFLGLTTKKPHVLRVTLLSVPLLLVVYSINPLFVLNNYLPWSIFGALSTSPINLLMWVLTLTGHLLMIWGALRGVSPNLGEQAKNVVKG
ncbi:MAG: hypothetical protein WC325_10940 [Candidatus Bathyarchaeia archaeon]|jgi:hypothetical protein